MGISMIMATINKCILHTCFASRDLPKLKASAVALVALMREDILSIRGAEANYVVHCSCSVAIFVFTRVCRLE